MATIAPRNETATRPPDAYQVFISYSRRDTDGAEQIGLGLRERGLSVFLDRWCLPEGVPWIEQIESALGSCPAVVIIIGPGGLGDWQRPEAELALDRQRRGQDVRVLPVLLPRSEPPLGFLRLNTWIDLRTGVGPEGIERLALAVTGAAQPPAVMVCPYRGLRPFRQEDSDFFFGREEFVERALAVVARCSVAAVVGASGSGKSSAVRAGVLPRLARGDPASRWQIAVLSPGRAPMHALAAGLLGLRGQGQSDADRLLSISKIGDELSTGDLPVEAVAEDLLGPADTGRLLLFVDQWEELYTQCQDKALRRRFIDGLLRAAEHPRIGVLITVRGDFFDDVLEHRALADRLEGGVLNLGPMNEPELRRCMQEPARRVGLDFEEGLVDRIIEDVHGEPGTLPLLEFVLQQLWKKRHGDRLVHESYREIGEIKGALADHAEARLAELDPAERTLARRTLLKLVQTGPAMSTTRRRATRAEVGEEAWPVALRLADARLLVTGRSDATDEETVEVAHEALIRHWGRLRAWIDEDREFLLWRRRLQAGLEQYANAPTDTGILLRGGPLREAERWCRERPDDLSPAELSFIDASTRRARQIRRRFVAAGSVAAIVVLAAAFFAERFLDQRQVARLLHEGRVLREAVEASDPVVAALLAASLDGRARRAPPAGAPNARRIADRAIPLAVLDRSGSRLTAAAISPDGERVLAGYGDGVVLLWPANDSGPPVRLAELERRIRVVEFSADGSRLLALAEGAAPALMRPSGGVEPGPWRTREVVDARFAGTGDAIVAVYGDSTVRVWPLTGGATGPALRLDIGEPLAAVPERGGRRVAVLAGDVVALWDPASSARPDALRGHRGRVVAAAFSPNGASLATASHDGTVRLWDLESLRDTVVMASSDGSAAWSVAFDSGGDRVVAGFDDSAIRVWSADGVRAFEHEHGPDDSEGPFGPHPGAVWAAAFHPGGHYLVGAGADRRAWLWPLAGGPAIELDGRGDTVFLAAFSEGGRRLITGSRGGEVRVWPGVGRLDPAALPGTEPPCTGAASSAAGRVAVGCEDGVVQVWDVSGRIELLLRDSLPSAVSALAFDPAGTRLAAGTWAGLGMAWNLEGPTRIGSLAHHDAIVSVVFEEDRIYTASFDSTAKAWPGPDFLSSMQIGRHSDILADVAVSTATDRIATAAEDGTVHVWAGLGGTRIAELTPGDPVSRLVFSPDGRRLLVLSSGSGVLIVSLEDGSDNAGRLEGHRVTAAAFDARGRRLATGTDAGLVRIWDAAVTEELQRLRDHRGRVRMVRFDDTGRRLATAGGDSTARIHPLDGSESTTLRHPLPVVDDAVFLEPGRLVTFTASGATVWRVAWSDLHAYLEGATTACLSPTDRIQSLRESPGDAADAHRECERRWGRDAEPTPENAR
jgi:WD40 repeat protein